MKKLLLIIALAIYYFQPAKAQSTLASFPETDGNVVYESIVDVPGKSKDFIYFNASKWILDIPNNVKARITTEDNNQGQIVANATFLYQMIISGWLGNANYHFKIEVDCKDNKYRIRLYELSYIQASTDPNKISYTFEDLNQQLKSSTAKPRHEVAAQINNILNGIMSSLKDAMNKAAKDDF